MTDWRSLRGSNFLTWEDLETPALITITKAESEKMLDEKENVKKEVMITFTGRQRNASTGVIEDMDKTEWTANVVNLTLLEALFGTPHVEQWAGRKALLQKEPCEVPGKYYGTPSVRVCGGPDLERDLPVAIVLKMKGGKKRKPINKVLHPTRNGGGGSPQTPPVQVDPTTGEVAQSAPPANPPAPTPQGPVFGDDGAAAATEAFTGPTAVAAPEPQQPTLTPPHHKTAVEIAQENYERALAQDAARPITAGDVNWIATQCTTHGITEQQLLTYLTLEIGVDSVEAIPATRLDEVKAWINGHPLQAASS